MAIAIRWENCMYESTPPMLPKKEHAIPFPNAIKGVSRRSFGDAIAPYAPVILKLLQNPLYHDDAASWTLLLSHLAAIRDYFARIGLEIHVNETEGFAFLHQPELE